MRDGVWVGSKRCVWVGSKRSVWVIEAMVEVIVMHGWMCGLYDDDMRWLLNRKPRHSITTKQIDCKLSQVVFGNLQIGKHLCVKFSKELHNVPPPPPPPPSNNTYIRCTEVTP